MAAGLVVPISGPYVGTWNAFPLGVQHDDGYEISCTMQGQEVNETDAYGMTLTEAIWRGFNWRARFRGLEWKSGLLAILKMFGTTGTANDGLLNPQLINIGDRWTKYCQVLLLTAILANPPTTPQTLSATNAGIAPQSESAFLMTSKVRELPIEMVLIPYSTTVGSLTVNVPFTVT